MTDVEYFTVARNILRAAMSESYPTVVDQAAHPGVVLGCAAALVIEAGDRTDDGLEMLLNEGAEMAYYSRSDLTDQERAVAKEMLRLAWVWHGKPNEFLFERARAWADVNYLADTLSLISVTVQLLQWIETLKTGVLADIDGELEMQAWVAQASEQLATTTTLEDL